MSSENLWKPLVFDIFRWLNRNRTLAWNGLTVDLKVLTSRIEKQSSFQRLQRPDSSVQIPAARFQRPESSAQGSASRIQRSESSVQLPAFRVQRPECRAQRPECRVQRPESSNQLLRPEPRDSGMPWKHSWYTFSGLSWNKKILKIDFQNFVYCERLSYWICFHAWLILLLSMTSAKI